MLKYFPLIALVAILVISGCTTPQPPEEEVDGPYDTFAQCLKDSGLVMYGTFTCSVCNKQRALFEGSFPTLGEVECHPDGENPQTALCFEKDITHTPTWILEPNGIEQERKIGFQTLNTLGEWTGCEVVLDE